MKRTNRKFLLGSVFVFALIFHAGALLLLKDIPISTGLFSLEKSAFLSFGNENREEVKMRTRELCEIFEQLTLIDPTHHEVKEELRELSGEFAPLIPSLPVGDLPEIGLTFEPSPLKENGGIIANEDRLSFNEEGMLVGSGTLLTAPYSEGNATPPLADMFPSGNDYDPIGELAGSEHFDVKVEVASKRMRPGYVFRLTFQPREGVHFKRIRQNFYFLIDRSNSIPRSRYVLNKQAVAAALEFLKPSDTFNILIFDGKVVRLAEKNLPYTRESVRLARHFLEEQGHGGFFAATELYASLGKIIPEDVADTEVNTAILLSDGDTFLRLDHQRRTIGEWTERNQGKVALHSVASGSGNNLSLLELISAFNKGRLTYSPRHDEVKERLVALMQHLQNPIGKHIVATPVTSDDQTIVMLQPKNLRLPDLYEHTPFVVYGSTNRLNDFTLFLQGKYYDRRFDIKKRISFSGAAPATLNLEKSWTALVAQEHFNSFFKDGKMVHLESARQLLEPLGVKVPFLEAWRKETSLREHRHHRSRHRMA